MQLAETIATMLSTKAPGHGVEVTFEDELSEEMIQALLYRVKHLTSKVLVGTVRSKTLTIIVIA